MKVRDLAKQLHVTKQSVNQHIARNRTRLGRHVHKVKNRTDIDKVGAKLIADTFNVKRNRNRKDRHKITVRLLERELKDKQVTINNQQAIIADYMSQNARLRYSNQHLLNYKQSHRSLWQKLKDLF